MTRIIRMYVAFLGLLLVLGLVGIGLTRVTGFSGALRKLGKGDNEYQAARNTLLLSPNDPAPLLARYIADSRHSKRARAQALSIFGALSSQQELGRYGRQIAAVLADTSRDLRLQALRTLLNMQTLNGADKVVDLLRASDDTAIVNLAHQAIRDPVQTIEFVIESAKARNDSAALDSCIHKTVLDSFYLMALQGWAFKIGRYFAAQGRFDEAEQYSHLGVIANWWVIAGWPNREMKAFYAPLPPETEPFDSLQTWKISDTVTARWTKVDHLDNSYGDIEPVIDFVTRFQPNLYSVAYCRTFIHSPEDRKVFLLIGSDDGERVWLNDSLVLSHKCFRGSTPDNDLIKVRLRKGANKLLIKVTQDVGGWAFCCRVTNYSGHGMRDVFASRDSVPDTMAVQRMLDRMEKKQIAWSTPFSEIGKEVESFDPSDDRNFYSLLRVFLDPLQDSRRRSHAAMVLAISSGSGRVIPYGEREIIAFCDSMLRAKPDDALILDAATMLAWFGSVRALDIGKKLRASNITALARAGNTIVGSVVKARLKNIPGILRHDIPYMKKQLEELAALDPEDAGAIHALMLGWQSIGDTVRAKAIAQKAVIPAQWIFFPMLGDNRSKAVEFGRKSGSFSLAALQADSAHNSRPIKIADNALTGNGMHFLNIFSFSPDWNGLTGMFAEITSARDDSILICIPLVDGTVFCNGEQCRPIPGIVREVPVFNPYAIPEQIVDFHESGIFSAKIKAGVNKISVCMQGGSLVRLQQISGIRIGFKDRSGHLLTFNDNTIKWRDAQ
jgi:hypothetical protein